MKQDLPPADVVPRRAVALVALMWFAYFLNYCDRQIVFALFPVFRKELGFDEPTLGLIGTAFLWVYAIGCPIAGKLGDSYSKRLLIILSLALWSLVTIAIGFSNGPAMLLLLRGAMGVSEALYMPAAIALTANAFVPALRSRAIAALTTAQVAGTVAGSWFGGWMGDHGRWREAFFWLGAVGLAYAVPYAIFLRSTNETPAEANCGKTQSGNWGEMFRTPTYWVLCVVFSAFVFGVWLIYGWLPRYFSDKFSLNMTDSASNATIYLQGATIVGILGGGFVADTLRRRVQAGRLILLVVSLAVCAPCIAALGRCESLSATRLAAAGLGLAGGLFMGNVFPGAYDVVRSESRAQAVGVLNFFGSLVAGIATMLGGRSLKDGTPADRVAHLESLFDVTVGAYIVAALLLTATIATTFRRDYARIHDQDTSMAP